MTNQEYDLGSELYLMNYSHIDDSKTSKCSRKYSYIPLKTLYHIVLYLLFTN